MWYRTYCREQTPKVRSSSTKLSDSCLLIYRTKTKRRKSDITEIILNICFRGEKLLKPRATGDQLEYICQRYHTRCIWGKIFISKDHGAAHCTACKRLLPNFDQTLPWTINFMNYVSYFNRQTLMLFLLFVDYWILARTFFCHMHLFNATTSVGHLLVCGDFDSPSKEENRRAFPAVALGT